MIILIVEDAPEIVELWKRMLSTVARSFRVADNIEDALEEMRRAPCPDLVLLDLRLNGSAAEETVQRIRDFRSICPAAIVLVVTGNPDPSLPALAQQFGAHGFESKQSVASQDRLLSAVKTAFANGVGGDGKPYEQRLALLETLTGLVTCAPGSATAAE